MLGLTKKFIFVIYVIIFAIFLFNKFEAKRNVIHVGVDAYSPPFSSTNNIGELNGYTIDILKAIGRILDYRIEFRILPFTALEKSLETEVIDVIVAPFDTSKIDLNKDKKMIYSEPYYNNALSVMYRTDNNFKHYHRYVFDKDNLCMPNKPFIFNHIRKYYKTRNLQIYENSKKATDALFKGSCDLLVDTKSSNEYYKTKHNLKRMKVMILKTAVDYKHVYRFAISRNKSWIQDDINRAMEHLRQTGELNTIHQKWFSSNFYSN